MTRRLFFALWPHDGERAALVDATRTALSSVRGRPVPSENYHLTLAFLGSIAEERLGDVLAAGEGAARAPIAPVPLDVVLDSLAFWRKAQIVAAEASAVHASATARARALHEQLLSRGFAPDLKPFRAHVTLVRKVSRASAELSMGSVRWSFRQMALVDSRTLPEGSAYSVLESWPLCSA